LGGVQTFFQGRGWRGLDLSPGKIRRESFFRAKTKRARAHLIGSGKRGGEGDLCCFGETRRPGCRAFLSEEKGEVLALKKCRGYS